MDADLIALETPSGHLLVLQPGEELIRSLISFAREYEIDGAWLIGIGSVEQAELATFRADVQGFERHVFHEPLEVCSLTGNLSLLDGAPYPHVHAVLARSDCSVVGGHVFEAVCAVTVELTVQTTPRALVRGPAGFCNLSLLKLETRV